jgi:hypothetical protein
VGALGRSELDGLRWATPMFEWRVFATGSEGKGPVGGAIEGREGRGSVVPDMLSNFQRVCKCWAAAKVLGTRCQPEQPFFFRASLRRRNHVRYTFTLPQASRTKLKW